MENASLKSSPDQFGGVGANVKSMSGQLGAFSDGYWGVQVLMLRFRMHDWLCFSSPDWLARKKLGSGIEE